VLLDGTFKSLHENDNYTDKWIIDKRMARDAGPPTMGRPAFKPSNPSGKPAGAGSLYGTIGKVPLVTKSMAGAGDIYPPPDPTLKGKKNLYTSPAKKGGFGFPTSERTIGGKVPEYMKDDYEPGLQLTRTARQEARKRIPKAFNSGGRCRDYFDTSLHKYKEEGYVGAQRRREEGAPKKPFRPTNPGPKGRFAVLSKVGRNYVPEAEMPEKKEGPPAAEMSSKKFVPPGSLHSKYTKDINPYMRPVVPEKPAVYVWEGGKG